MKTESKYAPHSRTLRAPVRPIGKYRVPTLTHKQQVFTEEYAKTLNATEAASKAYDVESRHTAQAIGSENLSKPVVREAIAKQLQENGIEMQDIYSTHKRNMLQQENLPTSQKAVSDFYEILGMKGDRAQEAQQKNIAIIVNLSK